MIEASLCTRDIDGGSYGHPTVETLFVGTKVCGENESTGSQIFVGTTSDTAAAS